MISVVAIVVDQVLPSARPIDGDLVVTNTIVVARNRDIIRCAEVHGVDTADSAGDCPHTQAIDDRVNRRLSGSICVEVAHNRNAHIWRAHCERRNGLRLRVVHVPGGVAGLEVRQIGQTVAVEIPLEGDNFNWGAGGEAFGSR